LGLYDRQVKTVKYFLENGSVTSANNQGINAVRSTLVAKDLKKIVDLGKMTAEDRPPTTIAADRLPTTDDLSCANESW